MQFYKVAIIVKDLKTTVYKAHPKTHFFKELFTIFKDIKNSHFLAFQMAKRDISAMYRQSFLGLFWALAPVIANSLVWIFLKNSGGVNLAETAMPYAVYATVGTTLWFVFTEAVNSPIQNINAARGTISKINFPKEALLVSGLYKILFNAIIKIVLVVVFLLYFRILPSQSLIGFPIYLIALIFLGTAIGILLAPIGLLYTDIGRGIQLIFTFFMFVSPVVIPAEKIHKQLYTVYQYNPLSPLIEDGRNSIAGFPIENLPYVFLILLISLVLISLGLVIFRNSMNIIIEKIAS